MRKTAVHPNKKPAPGIGESQTRPSDFLARAIDVRPFDHARLGLYFVRTFFLTAFPREVDLGWLDALLAYPDDIDTAIHVVPLDERESIDEITRIIARLQAEDALRGTNIRYAQEISQAIQDAVAVRQLLQDNVARLHRVAVVANLYGRSREALDRLQRVVLAQLAGRRIHPMFAEGRMEEGLLSVSPLGVNLLDDAYHIMDSFALSTTCPFIQADLMDEGGIPLGWNRITGNPVLYDPWALPNQNGIVYAAPGFGKTSAIRMLAARARLMGVRAVIIDPEGEYGGMVEAMGGVRIRIGSRRNPEVINVGDLLPEIEEDGTESVSIGEKVLDISGLIQFVIPGLSPQDAAVLETAIADEYRERGLDSAPGLYTEERVVRADAYRRGRRLRPMPTLSDFAQRLSRPEYRSQLTSGSMLLAGLSRLTKEGALGFFDHPTNVDVDDAPIVSFDLADLRDAGQSYAFYVVLAWIWEHFVKRGGGRRFLVVDEAWMLVDGGVGSRFLEAMARRCRKRQVGFFVVSHDVERFEGDPHARVLNQTAATKVFLRQEARAAASLKAAFRLPEGEIAYLTSHAERGDAVLHAGGRAVVLHFEPTMAEAPWVHEKPRGRRVAVADGEAEVHA